MIEIADDQTTAFPSFCADDVAATRGLYRVLDPAGVPISVIGEPAETGVDDDTALRLWRSMARQRLLDERMLSLQRQGRIGFYGAATGQEAAVFGAAEALEARDWIHPALREGGMALHRGYPLHTYLSQCFGNADDTSTRGRQMPCHYGSREHGYVTLSSVMTTQLPQAVGTAYAMAMRDRSADRPVCFVAVGDGAVSEGDFHVAMNFAGVMRPGGRGLPLVIFCQNNQWAISTPGTKQCAAETLASKALGYGLAGVRVDGNDALAVLRVVREAVRSARQGVGTPVFIEAVTYRVSAHSTSDDPSRYRDEAVTREWQERDPIARLESYLINRGALNEGAAATLRADFAVELREALARAEAVEAPQLESAFEDVWAQMPAHLRSQLARCRSNAAD